MAYQKMAAWLIILLNFALCDLLHANSYQYQPPVYQYEPYVPMAQTEKTNPPTPPTTVQTVPATTTTPTSTTTSTSSTTTAAQTTAPPTITTETRTELNYKVGTSAVPATDGPPDQGYFSGYIPLGGFDGQINGHSKFNGNGVAPYGEEHHQQAMPPPPPSYQINPSQTAAPTHENVHETAEAYHTDPMTYQQSSKVAMEPTTPLVPAPPVPFGEHSGTTQSQTEYEHFGARLIGTTGSAGLHVDPPSPPAPHSSSQSVPEHHIDGETGEGAAETPEPVKHPETVVQPGYMFPSMINYGSINGPPPPKFVLERRGNKLKPQKAPIGYGYGYPPSPRTTPPVATRPQPDTTTTTAKPSTTAATTETTTTTLAPTTTATPGTTAAATTEPSHVSSYGAPETVTPCTNGAKSSTSGHVEATTGTDGGSTIEGVTPCKNSRPTITVATPPPPPPLTPVATAAETKPPPATAPIHVPTIPPVEASTPCTRHLSSMAPSLTTVGVVATEPTAPEETYGAPKPPCTKGQGPPMVDDHSPVVVDHLPSYDQAANGKPMTSANCEDGFDKCVEWADDGECEANPFWMKPNCQKSCKTCGVLLVDIEKPTAKTENCLNHHELCQFWKKVGECERNEPYMSRHCPLSCGFC